MCRNMLVEMWCMLAEVSTKYMESCQQINEGDAAKHSFSTIQAILAYPFSYLFLEDLTQVSDNLITFNSRVAINVENMLIKKMLI